MANLTKLIGIIVAIVTTTMIEEVKAEKLWCSIKTVEGIIEDKQIDSPGQCQSMGGSPHYHINGGIYPYSDSYVEVNGGSSPNGGHRSGLNENRSTTAIAEAKKQIPIGQTRESPIRQALTHFYHAESLLSSLSLMNMESFCMNNATFPGKMLVIRNNDDRPNFIAVQLIPSKSINNNKQLLRVSRLFQESSFPNDRLFIPISIVRYGGASGKSIDKLLNNTGAVNLTESIAIVGFVPIIDIVQQDSGLSLSQESDLQSVLFAIERIAQRACNKEGQ